MQRTRTPGAASSSSINNKQDNGSPGSNVVNGNENAHFPSDTQANDIGMEKSTADGNTPVASDTSVYVGNSSSLYDTPSAHGFNQGDKTEYDIDATATMSQSELASVLPNQGTEMSPDNEETAALGSMLGIHSPNKANGDSQQLSPLEDPFQ